MPSKMQTTMLQGRKSLFINYAHSHKKCIINSSLTASYEGVSVIVILCSLHCVSFKSIYLCRLPRMLFMNESM